MNRTDTDRHTTPSRAVLDAGRCEGRHDLDCAPQAWMRSSGLAVLLDVDDPTRGRLAAARAAWAAWQVEEPALGVVGDLLDLPGWLRAAPPQDADVVLLALARLASIEGEDDVLAAAALAWVLLPGAIAVARRLAWRIPDAVDQAVAAALWERVRTAPWRGHKVAANTLRNTAKTVMKDLASGAGTSTVCVAPDDDWWTDLPSALPGLDAPPQDDAAQLLRDAVRDGAIAAQDAQRLWALAHAGGSGARRRRGGLTAGQALRTVAALEGCSTSTITRRAQRTADAVRHWALTG